MHPEDASSILARSMSKTNPALVMVLKKFDIKQNNPRHAGYFIFTVFAERGESRFSVGEVGEDFYDECNFYFSEESVR